MLNETLRLFPPVPSNIRATTDNGYVLPGTPPLYVPPRTSVNYQLLLVQRDQDTWGPDADTFDPQRWLDPKRDTQTRLSERPGMFAPFHAGPRLVSTSPTSMRIVRLTARPKCLGQQLALNEAALFLVRLLQEVDHVELAPDMAPPSAQVPKEWTGRSGREGVERCVPQVAVTLFVRVRNLLKPKYFRSFGLHLGRTLGAHASR